VWNCAANEYASRKFNKFIKFKYFFFNFKF